MVGSFLEILFHGALVAWREGAAPGALTGDGSVLPGGRGRTRRGCFPRRARQLHDRCPIVSSAGSARWQRLRFEPVEWRRFLAPGERRIGTAAIDATASRPPIAIRRGLAGV